MYVRSIALLALALLALPAHAELAAPDKYKPGNVIIAFEGGVVGEAMGNVLLSLAKDQNLLFTTPYTIAKGDSVCQILITRGYPTPCSAQLLQAIDLLNPAAPPSRRQLAIGQTILLPDIWLRKYTTGRSLSTIVPAERNRAAAIKRSWSHLNANVAQSTARSEQVEFQAYELILRSPDPARQKQLIDRVAPYRSANVRVTPIGFLALKAKAFGYDARRYEQECTRTPPVPPSKIDYRSYADVDGDLANLVAQRPANARSVKVYLIDVKLEQSPNLAGAVEGGSATAPAAAWNCAWAGEGTSRQHATHLAGIIASRDNGFGFVGLSPSSTIVSYEFLQPNPASDTGLDIPPERVPWLADAINENRGNEQPYLYLVASSFPDFDATALDARGQITKDYRISDERPIENRISDLRPLFIVAAGQTSRPVALSPTTPMSPQNLGDLRNVLVVSACEICMRAAPKLMPEANYGALDGRYVHVAAPGGSPILGWVSGTGVGEAKGTSQAAAYAAGVAAEMIGRWPENYKEADYVKRRIQVTSWPMFSHPGSDDHLKIATGLVDPVLALVDPKLTWLKDASGWRSVRLKGFSEPRPVFRTSNGEVIASYKTIARLIRINSTDPAKWILYRAGGMGEVTRDGPLTADAALEAVTCNDERIPLRDVQDLVINNGLLTETSCAH